MPTLGGWEIVIIVAVLLLLFGAKKLPDMARSVGQSARVFKGEMKGLKDDEGPKDAKETAPEKPTTSTAPTAPSAPAELPQAQPTVAPSQQESTAGGSASQAQPGRTDAT